MVGKTYRVVLTDYANNKLQSIFEFYKSSNETDLGRKVTNVLLEASKLLKTLPSSKAKLPTKKRVVPPLRYSKKWSYKIVFQVFENDDTVLVLDFLHDKEHPEKWEQL